LDIKEHDIMRNLTKLLHVAGLGLLITLGTTAQASITLEFEGIVTDQAFKMGTDFDPPLFGVGDAFHGTFVLNDTSTALEGMNYVVGDGGGNFTYSLTSFTGWLIGITPTMIYGIRTDGLLTDNWSYLLNTSFSHNLNSTDILHGYNFNVTPVPEAGTLLAGAALALITGAQFLRRRATR
jgi:hypothetical protein